MADQLNKSQTEIGNALKEKKSLNNQLTKARKTNQQLQNKQTNIERLRDKIHILEKDREETTLRIQQLEEEMDTQNFQFREVEDELEEEKAYTAHLRVENEKLQLNVNSLTLDTDTRIENEKQFRNMMEELKHQESEEQIKREKDMSHEHFQLIVTSLKICLASK
eukprot:UN23949